MPDFSLPLRTERLVLRRFGAGDLDGYFAYHSLRETARFLPGEAKSYTECMERVGAYANYSFEKPGDWVVLAIESAADPGIIGEVVLKWLPGTGQAEVGWSLAPEARGHGYATEAADAVLQLGFEKLDFHRICANLDARNTASAAICSRLGMREEARQIDKWHYKGEWATEVVFAILADEWRVAKDLARTAQGRA
ncbi:GNAT family N-acetyltransferase [Pseudarthrobacter sp. J75]|uniref:GNAT family N-acetyltransferase n=1 Tax=unclassified Pseudarthrobacter TaxID=2647000 RepID=UPI002E80CB13|nr:MULTISPECIES: GNAT family N-acetyltransferase [unclassified Pseudarthrobacter]MEE2522084.1 GNAT family N-acetyltransferase [Pseudarthrobacter sp. J47]MEE2529009.1 GNAT family N-acetyltransferase [Pseudarthrobacter sp. J75]MEE2570659.1 GNAT family N-acetyltransferase [Pseudarthrobacter sp. J64]